MRRLVVTLILLLTGSIGCGGSDTANSTSDNLPVAPPPPTSNSTASETPPGTTSDASGGMTSSQSDIDPQSSSLLKRIVLGTIRPSSPEALRLIRDSQPLERALESEDVETRCLAAMAAGIVRRSSAEMRDKFGINFITQTDDSELVRTRMVLGRDYANMPVVPFGEGVMWRARYGPLDRRHNELDHYIAKMRYSFDGKDYMREFELAECLEYAFILGNGGTGLLARLIELSNDENETLRWTAVIAMAQITEEMSRRTSDWPEPDVTSCLTRSLKDESPGIRLAAVSGLGHKGETALPDIIDAYQDAESQIRLEVILILGRFVNDARLQQEAKSTLEAALRDDSILVQEAARAALDGALIEFNGFREPVNERIAAIERLVPIKDESIQFTQIAAISQIADWANEDIVAAEPLLLKVLGSESGPKTVAASRALVRIGEKHRETVMQQLINASAPMLFTDHEQLTGFGEDRLMLIKEFNPGSDETTRVLLGQLHGRQDWPVAHLATEIAPTSNDALRMLLASVGKYANPIYGDLYADALVGYGDDAIPGLEKIINGDNELARIGAAKALWQIAKDERSIPLLIDVLKSDRNQSVVVAEYLIGQIGPDASAAIPELVRLIKTQGIRDGFIERIQLNAADALGKIGPGANVAVETLEEIVSQKHFTGEFVQRVWMAFERINPERAAEVLGELKLKSIYEHP